MSSSSAFIPAGGAGGVASIDGDTGSAAPVAGVVTIAGADNIATTGAGSTITVSLEDLIDNAIFVGNGTSAFTSLAVGTNGQLLTGSSAANPVFSTPLSTDNTIEFTAGAGTIDFSYRGTIDTNPQTVSYQLVLSDRGNLITVDNAGATTLTVPPNSTEAFPIGTSILVAQLGAGQITIAAGAGVTLNSAAGLLSTALQYSMLTLVKVLSDEWLVSGDTV